MNLNIFCHMPSLAFVCMYSVGMDSKHCFIIEAAPGVLQIMKHPLEGAIPFTCQTKNLLLLDNMKAPVR